MGGSVEVRLDIYIGEVSEAVTMTKSRGGGGRKGARGGRNTFGNGGTLTLHMVIKDLQDVGRQEVG